MHSHPLIRLTPDGLKRLNYRNLDEGVSLKSFVVQAGNCCAEALWLQPAQRLQVVSPVGAGLHQGNLARQRLDRRADHDHH